MNAAEDPQALARRFGPAAGWLVVLDFDGVLSPIVARPEDAAAAPGAVDAIRELTARTEVAIVSGRPIAQLRERLGDLPVTFAGGHGAEVITADGTSTALVDDLETVADALETAAHEVGEVLEDAEGWQIERKDASLAVHHRRADDADRDRRLPTVLEVLEAHRTTPPGFELLQGKAVVELRPAGVDKGRALAHIADRDPSRPPLVIGDDVTDEDAFEEAARRGGASILVATHPRATVARWRLHDPDAVVAFLRAMTATGPEGEPGG